jgi:hypothetical protein
MMQYTIELTLEEINALWELVLRAPKTAAELVGVRSLQERFEAATERQRGDAPDTET